MPKGVGYGGTNAMKSTKGASSGKKGTAAGSAAKSGTAKSASARRTGGSKNESRGAIKYPTSQGT